MVMCIARLVFMPCIDMLYVTLLSVWAVCRLLRCIETKSARYDRPWAPSVILHDGGIIQGGGLHPLYYVFFYSVLLFIGTFGCVQGVRLFLRELRWTSLYIASGIALCS
jgi:hypothetical protein